MAVSPDEAGSTPSTVQPPARGNSLEVAFDACPLPTLILETGKMCILEANPAAAELLGVPAGDLIGEQFLLFFTNEAAMDEFVHLLPDFSHTSRQSVEKSGKLQMRRRDGGMIFVQAHVATCRLVGGHPGFVLSLHDLTSGRSAAEAAIGKSEAALYQHLIDAIGDGFMVLNKAGLTTYANPGAARLLGLAPSFMLGRKLRDLFPQLHKEDLSRLALPSNREPQAQPVRIPVFLGCELHQFELLVHPCEGGQVILFRDISERVKQEVEIAKLNATMAVSQQLLRSKNEELNASLDELARLNEQLANADRLKSDFLANTSHELRTPLNSIIGFLQLISEGLCENPEEEQEYVRNALTSSQHLLSLINDVLDIAKIEAGKMTLLIDDIDLDMIFHEVFSLTHIQAQQKNLKLTFEIHADCHRIIRADFHKVKQVLINLIGNAIKFTSSGYIRAWAEPSPENPDMMLISVQDTGIGVPVNQQQSVFEKFVQVDGTSTRKYQGSGLGLAISRNLVDLMGGSIGIFSEGLHTGTRMFFTMPMGNAGHGASGLLDDMDVEGALPTTF